MLLYGSMIEMLSPRPSSVMYVRVRKPERLFIRVCDVTDY